MSYLRWHWIALGFLAISLVRLLYGNGLAYH